MNTGSVWKQCAIAIRTGEKKLWKWFSVFCQANYRRCQSDTGFCQTD